MRVTKAAFLLFLSMLCALGSLAIASQKMWDMATYFLALAVFLLIVRRDL